MIDKDETHSTWIKEDGVYKHLVIMKDGKILINGKVANDFEHYKVGDVEYTKITTKSVSYTLMNPVQAMAFIGMINICIAYYLLYYTWLEAALMLAIFLIMFLIPYTLTYQRMTK